MVEPAIKKKKLDATSQAEYNISSHPSGRENKDTPASELCMYKLALDSFSPFERVLARSVCPGCGLTRRYYCPVCLVSFLEKTPHVELPLRVTVLQHPKEKPERSSVIPARLIAPGQVRICADTKLPKDVTFDPKDTVLLYPRADAKSLKEMGQERISQFKHVVIIDSTWGQVNTYLNHEEIKALPAVKIATKKSTFWRYQRLDEENLSTIEALYFFFREYSETLAKSEEKYDGRFDNLLYFYAYTYQTIQERYKKIKKPVSIG